MSIAVSPHHDDDHVGAARGIASRAGARDWLGIAAPAWDLNRGRIVGVAISNALYHAGHLPLYGPARTLGPKKAGCGAFAHHRRSDGGFSETGMNPHWSNLDCQPRSYTPRGHRLARPRPRRRNRSGFLFP